MKNKNISEKDRNGLINKVIHIWKNQLSSTSKNSLHKKMSTISIGDIMALSPRIGKRQHNWRSSTVYILILASVAHFSIAT